MYLYKVRLRKSQRGVDLISDALVFGRLWYDGPNAVANAIGGAQFYSRSHDAVIRVYYPAGSLVETHDDVAISKSGDADNVCDSGSVCQSEAKVALIGSKL